MILDPGEKRAGRIFRAKAQAALDDLNKRDPAAATAPPFLANYRHPCPVHPGRTLTFELREHYDESPQLWVCPCGEVDWEPYFPHPDCDGGTIVAQAGRFGFIWQEGRCPDCRLRVRSTEGRLVDALVRPPGERSIRG